MNQNDWCKFIKYLGFVTGILTLVATALFATNTIEMQVEGISINQTLTEVCAWTSAAFTVGGTGAVIYEMKNKHGKDFGGWHFYLPLVSMICLIGSALLFAGYGGMSASMSFILPVIFGSLGFIGIVAVGILDHREHKQLTECPPTDLEPTADAPGSDVHSLSRGSWIVSSANAPGPDVQPEITLPRTSPLAITSLAEKHGVEKGKEHVWSDQKINESDGKKTIANNHTDGIVRVCDPKMGAGMVVKDSRDIDTVFKQMRNVQRDSVTGKLGMVIKDSNDIERVFSGMRDVRHDPKIGKLVMVINNSDDLKRIFGDDRRRLRSITSAEVVLGHLLD